MFLLTNEAGLVYYMYDELLQPRASDMQFLEPMQICNDFTESDLHKKTYLRYSEIRPLPCNLLPLPCQFSTKLQHCNLIILDSREDLIRRYTCNAHGACLCFLTT